MSATAWITGAHGFIGRHLARECRGRGMRVAGLGHGRWEEGEAERWGIEAWERGDVTASSLDRLAAGAPAPDLLFHLAGGSSVGLSLAAPDEDFQRTVVSTAELLGWMARAAPEALLVLASSAAVYGARGVAPIPEGHGCAPCSPYGHHKRVSELLARSYARARRLRVVSVRMFSVYGPGLRKQLLWDLCVRLSRSPDSILLSGTGHETRDFLHVSDATRLLADRAVRRDDRAAQAWTTVNGGTGIATPVRAFAELVARAWGEAVPLRFNGRRRAGDPPSLVADIRRLREDGWAPRVGLEEGIAEYVAWFRGAAVPAAS